MRRFWLVLATVAACFGFRMMGEGDQFLYWSGLIFCSLGVFWIQVIGGGDP